MSRFSTYNENNDERNYSLHNFANTNADEYGQPVNSSQQAGQFIATSDVFWNAQHSFMNQYDPPFFENSINSYHDASKDFTNSNSKPNMVTYSTYEIPSFSSSLTQNPLFQEPNIYSLANIPMVNTPVIHGENVLQKQPANEFMNPCQVQQLLDICGESRVPIRKCKNSIRGCQINTFCLMVNLHEEYCPFPFVRSFQVNGKLNLMLGRQDQLIPFCESYDLRYKVRFFFKYSQDKNLIIIVMKSQRKNVKYTISFKDFKGQMFLSINDAVGPDSHIIPSINLIQHGPLVKYNIRLLK